MIARETTPCQAAHLFRRWQPVPMPDCPMRLTGCGRVQEADGQWCRVETYDGPDGRRFQLRLKAAGAAWYESLPVGQLTWSNGGQQS